MPQIMRPRTAGPGPGGEPGTAGQLGEGLADVDIPQPGPGARYQQRLAGRARERLAPQMQVAPQRSHRSGVQREKPLLAELGVTHQEQGTWHAEPPSGPTGFARP